MRKSKNSPVKRRIAGLNGALMLLCLSSQNALAAREVGNGGDVIVCSNPGPGEKSVMLLDYYQAKGWEFTIDLGPPQLSYPAKLEIALTRLAELSPLRAKEYRKEVESFVCADPVAMTGCRDARFVPGVELVDIPDSNHIAIPVGCSIKQAAIQREPRFPEEKRYTISKDFWDRMDNDERAGLILHEVIYREALDYRHEDSERTRYFNAKLSANRLQGMKQREYLDFMSQTLEFQETDLNGVWLRFYEWVKPALGDWERKTNPIQYHPNGNVFTARVRSKSTQARPALLRSSDGFAIDFQTETEDEYYSASRAATFTEAGELYSIQGILLRVAGPAGFSLPPQFEGSAYWIRFNPAGKVQCLGSYDAQSRPPVSFVSADSSGTRVFMSIHRGSDEDTGYLARETTFTDSQGRHVTLPAGAWVSTRPDGIGVKLEWRLPVSDCSAESPR